MSKLLLLMVFLLQIDFSGLEIPDLIEGLQHREEAVRNKCVHELERRISSAESIPEAECEKLVTGLTSTVKQYAASNTGSYRNAMSACRMLGRLGPCAKDAVPALVFAIDSQSVEATSRRVCVRFCADKAVGEIGPNAKEAARHLVQLLENGAAPRDALEALGKIGPSAKSAVPFLTKKLSGLHRTNSSIDVCANALGRIGSDAKLAVPILMEIVRNSSSDGNRADAAKALGKISESNSSAIELLKEIASDKFLERKLRHEASEAVKLISQRTNAQKGESAR